MGKWAEADRASKSASVREHGPEYKYQSLRGCPVCKTRHPVRLNENDRCLVCEGKREHFYLYRPDLLPAPIPEMHVVLSDKNAGRLASLIRLDNWSGGVVYYAEARAAGLPWYAGRCKNCPGIIWRWIDDTKCVQCWRDKRGV